MDAPTLPVSAEKNLGDPIEIRVDIVHPAPADVFPAAIVMRTLAQHVEVIQSIHGHLQGVPINEKMNALRFRMGMAEEENASLRGRIKTIEGIDTITRRQEKRARMELERQLASVQESQRQDQENFRKLQEFVTSQLGRTHRCIILEFMSDFLVLKNQGTEARGRVYALEGGETNQDLDNTGDDINA
nr:hypothetical protein [Tanacetum cinerariifolium]